MRIIEVVPTIENLASGPAYSVPRLASTLAGLGHDVELMTVGGGRIEPDSPARHLSFNRDWREVPLLRSLWLSRGLKDALSAAAPKADIIHSNGLWVMPAVYPGSAAKQAGTPLVLSLRGTLSPAALSISRFRKRVFWTLVQGDIVRSAACLHATSEQEYADIRAYGLGQPVAIIPNGIDLPPSGHVARQVRGKRKLLYLGRIHPIKGLENLLRAWATISPRNSAWELELCGPGDEPYLSEIGKFARDLGLERVIFSGPVYGPDKDRRYRDADLYVLPSFSENFGMSVAEALSFAVPVITTTGTPWAHLVNNDAGWCVAPDAAALAGALATAMAMAPDDLRKMGDNGRAWMERDFGWRPIAQQMEALYNWLTQGGTAPETVRLN